MKFSDLTTIEQERYLKKYKGLSRDQLLDRFGKLKAMKTGNGRVNQILSWFVPKSQLEKRLATVRRLVKE